MEIISIPNRSKRDASGVRVPGDRNVLCPKGGEFRKDTSCGVQIDEAPRLGRIHPLLPDTNTFGRPRCIDWVVLEGIFWVLKTGARCGICPRTSRVRRFVRGSCATGKRTVFGMRCGSSLSSNSPAVAPSFRRKVRSRIAFHVFPSRILAPPDSEDSGTIADVTVAPLACRCQRSKRKPSGDWENPISSIALD